MKISNVKASKRTTVVAFALSAPLIYTLTGRALLHVVSANQVLDLSEDQASWLQFFFWAAFFSPIVWLAALAVSMVELRKTSRVSVLIVGFSSPFVVSAIHWVAWEAFIANASA
jgi:hypothetical protein